MEFKILGPFAVTRDGRPVAVSSHLQKSLLARLLVDANQVVATDRLIDDLWGDGGVKERQNSLWVHISNLRKLMSEDGADKLPLITRPPGYLLQVEPGAVDAPVFEGLVEEGRQLISRDPAAASMVLAEALSMWRGRALEDFAYVDWAQPEIRRLEEMRISAIETRIDADLASGKDSQLIGELESLVASHPMREHLVAQLMVALHRSERQSEALKVYARFSMALSQDLGLDPSQALQQLEEQILLNDPGIIPGLRAPGSTRTPGLAIRGYELREQISSSPTSVKYHAFQPSVGRSVHVEVIGAALANESDFIRRFDVEARKIAALEHPNIVPLYDYWREPDSAYLVTRAIGGDSFETKASNEWREGQMINMTRQVASALAAAHRRGVVHDAISPTAVVVDDDLNAYLGGFSFPSLSPNPSPTSPFVAPERATGADPSPAADVFSLGMTLSTSFESLPDGLAPIIERALDSDPSARFADAGEMLVAVDRLSDADDHTDVSAVNPYKGLRSYETSDAGEFFGRERVIERLIARIGHPGDKGRFVAVVGPSGSGKSSVVKAGVVAALSAGALPGSERWYFAEMVPAPHPFERLLEALTGIASTPLPRLLDDLLSDRSALSDLLTGLLPDDGSEVLLVVDQFEELFTQVAVPEAERFIDLLLSALEGPNSRLRLIVSLRADFYDRPLADTRLGALLSDSTEALPPLGPTELARAIEQPAAAQMVSYEPGLVATLANDVMDEPGALPLLQYALTELFERRSNRTIESATYVEIGGVAGALINRAETVYHALPDDARTVVRDLLLMLVTPGEEGSDTRRRVMVSEIERALGSSQTTYVLDELGRHRLLTFDRDANSRQPTVEIAHEALLRGWPRLAGWIEDAREDLETHDRVRSGAAEWVTLDRDPAFLLTGGWLALAETTVSEGKIRLSTQEEEFVEASVGVRDAAEARRTLRRRWIVASLGVAAVISLLLAGLAIKSSSVAEARARQAHAEALAGSAWLVLEEDPELSVLLAIEALESYPQSSTAIAVLNVALQSDAAFTSSATHRTVFSVSDPEHFVQGAISPDGSLLAAGFVDDRLEVWPVDSSAAEPLWTVEPEGDSAIAPVHFSADGTRLYLFQSTPVLESDGWTVHDAMTGEVIDEVLFPNDCSGTGFAHGTSDGYANPSSAVLLYVDETDPNITDGPPCDFTGESQLVAFHPGSGETQVLGRAHWDPVGVATLSDDGTRYAHAGEVPGGVYEVGRSEPLVELPPGVSTLSADGGLVLAGIDPMVLIEVDSGETLTEYPGAYSIAFFSHSGSYVVAASFDGATRLFDTMTGEHLVELRGSGSRDIVVSMTDDERLLATFSGDGSARVWDVSAYTTRSAASLGGLIPGSIVAAGRNVYVPSIEGVTTVFDLDASGAPTEIPGQVVEVSVDRSLMAVNTSDGLKVVDLTDGVSSAWSASFGVGNPTSSHFSPDGRYLAVGNEDGEVFVLDVGDGSLLHSLDPVDAESAGGWSKVRFSGDGTDLAVHQWSMAGDFLLRRVDTSNWETVDEIQLEQPITEIQYALDDTMLVGSDLAANVVLVDRESWSVSGRLEGQQGGALVDVAISPDRRLAATGSVTGSIWVWDLGERRTVQRITFPSTVAELSVLNVEFLDQQTLLVSDDQNLLVLTLDGQALLQQARASVTRSLTETECVTYSLEDCSDDGT